jgi:hypothetical protein
MPNTRAYFNLHKRCLSIQNKVDGVWKVVRHAEQIVLTDAEFKVSEAGRQRVIKEQRKNVHAVVLGNQISQINNLDFPKGRVYYNPYKAPTFVDANGEPIHNSKLVVICGNKQGYRMFADPA